ncbi:MAG: hypothetical protein H6712_26120 [Myxococcales bacterium]|nr:hypothetical protein [Myxococcales bacterium]MCB9717352.1 hypothetical protein [Myxococcales bacterium]
MSVAALAASAQSSGGYAVDAWLDMTLEPMTKLWQGVGGSSNFFFSEEDARFASGAYDGTRPLQFAESLWRMAQVQPHASLGYRREIAEYVVDMPIAAAVGVCTANLAFGGGSVFQYYVPDWEGRIYTTGRTFRFGAGSY